MQTVMATVRGQVQGVGFRWSTRRLAGDLGVTGWVRNRADGSVQVWAQGKADAVDALVAYLEVGPRGAVVHSVTVEEADPDDSVEGFHITY